MAQFPEVKVIGTIFFDGDNFMMLDIMYRNKVYTFVFINKPKLGREIVNFVIYIDCDYLYCYSFESI